MSYAENRKSQDMSFANKYLWCSQKNISIHNIFYIQGVCFKFKFSCIFLSFLLTYLIYLCFIISYLKLKRPPCITKINDIVKPKTQWHCKGSAWVTQKMLINAKKNCLQLNKKITFHSLHYILITNSTNIAYLIKKCNINAGKIYLNV